MSEIGEGGIGSEEPQEIPGENSIQQADAVSKTSAKSDRPKDAESLVAKKQRLFLVEFLVDTVTINSSEFCKEVMEGQTCVTLKFLEFPPMTICEKDFDPDKEYGGDKIRFNSGRSLMFAFTEKQCENPQPMMAELTVSKTCPEGSHVEKVELGRLRICMQQIFQQVYEIAKSEPEKLPASKSIKDCFMLIGRGKRTTGEVGVYVRLTCLGQNVVTEFRCGSDLKQDPILFKNREGKKIYQFTGTDKTAPENGPESGPTYRRGCGCLGPAPPEKYPGGQGDAGEITRGKNKSSGGRARAKFGRVVGAPDRGRPGEIAMDASDRYSQGIANSQLGKAGLTVDRMDLHPDQNCFVLRVGDKGQIPDRGKIILEFRTPKQKMLPKVLPPYHEDIATQTDSPKKTKAKTKKK